MLMKIVPNIRVFVLRHKNVNLPSPTHKRISNFTTAMKMYAMILRYPKLRYPN